MPATIQFVDSISASPTVRLDVNDAVSWFCGNFSAPPPRLRRSESGNSMRDGGIVSSSSYENRTLELELTLLNTSTEDAAATELQKLWRELDRPMNFLRYQREGMTKPVFFKVFRSDASDLEELWTTPIARNITVELLAEPFALGLRETLGPFTVTNDPAAGSNGLFFDATGVLGDVAVSPMMWWTSQTGSLWLGASHAAAAITGPYAQAELMTLGTDTTNPGGGPDAAMSGTGTNNFARTSFATNATMVTRLTTSLVPPGSWRALAVVRRSSAAGVINVRAQTVKLSSVVTSPSRATALSASRTVFDLGIISGSEKTTMGGGGVTNSAASTTLRIQAERISGSSTIDWDYVYLIPAGGQFAELAGPQVLTVMASDVSPTIDSTSELVSAWSAGVGDPSLGTATFPVSNPILCAGGFPLLHPGSMVNRIYVVLEAGGSHLKSTVTTVNVAYWPRYLFVRPVSS